MPLASLDGHSPQFAGAFCAPDAWIIGQVTIGEGSSVWFGAILRGDVEPITVGRDTNLQDGCILHGTSGVAGVVLGDRITVGHGAILHACTVEDEVLIGMRATVLDRVRIGRNSIIAAGSLVPPGKDLPGGWLYAGAPVQQKRQLTQEDLDMLTNSAANYVQHALHYAVREAFQ